MRNWQLHSVLQEYDNTARTGAWYSHDASRVTHARMHGLQNCRRTCSPSADGLTRLACCEFRKYSGRFRADPESPRGRLMQAIRAGKVALFSSYLRPSNRLNALGILKIHKIYTASIRIVPLSVRKILQLVQDLTWGFAQYSACEKECLIEISSSSKYLACSNCRHARKQMLSLFRHV